MKTKNLEYFINKICTVFTVPLNRNFKDENPATYPQPLFHYFVGKIIEISENGVLLEQWNSSKKLRSFFFINQIIGLAEEELLNPSDPNDAIVISEYKKMNEKIQSEAQKNYEQLKKHQDGEKYQIIGENNDETLDINGLSNLSEKIKNDL